jgi:hypothetical protein
MKTAVASTRSERRQQGKALREKLPRAAHAQWKPRAKSEDIVKLLEESDVGRIRGLLPVKYQRMAVSPFTFFAVRPSFRRAISRMRMSPASRCRRAAIATWRTLAASPPLSGYWCSTLTTSTKPFLVLGNGT